MTADISLFFEAFHFLRPWLLVCAAPVLWTWWRLRKRRGATGGNNGWLAPHLAAALTVPGNSVKRMQPIDVISLVLLLLVAAVAGPSWTRVPTPFAAQTAPLVVVMQVTQSMQNTDVAPERLARARQKTMDLLALRSGARTALVAFAGTAHVVVPMSEDPGVMQPYLEGLTTAVMPIEGQNIQAGFATAQALLAREGASGGVVFMVDELSASAAAELAEVWGQDDSAEDGAVVSEAVASMSFLFMLPEGTALPQVPDGMSATRVTPDNRDVTEVERSLASAFRRAQLEDEAQPWEDRGVWLAWPALALLLLWFRRGMAVRWAGQAAMVLWLLQPGQVQAEGWRDWFLTPDQQGWRAFERKDYADAAEAFEDPYMRGVALYRGGQYETAAQEMARLETADAAFLQGMAHLKSRGYRDGVRAFERALEMEPEHKGAQQNLPISKAIVEYVETTREQSDTGEDSGIGADDVVFDNESGRGEDTQIEVPQDEVPAHLSTEQWMRTVDTRTEDFLKQRFRLEAAREEQP
ncbi:vWA domain-containing protein [Shimia sagamensis]|uniref:Ca-activated chloride channel family protein n=1 Tax=Shimia sagamensis TaxID=1566352 RepID=A0ABY1PAT6_9RHOB|nr:VWA domain-containing protein [Shimia sagamensis]SMP28932.1 Ca-activated chloride channel family protein [Shimia sagamensis]